MQREQSSAVSPEKSTRTTPLPVAVATPRSEGIPPLRRSTRQKTIQSHPVEVAPVASRRWTRSTKMPKKLDIYVTEKKPARKKQVSFIYPAPERPKRQRRPRNRFIDE
jgi:hypothetical protein